MITKLKTCILIASLWGGAVKVSADKLEQHYALLYHLFAEPALNKNNLKSELEGITQDNTVGFFADYEETKIITLLTKPLISSGQLWFLSSSPSRCAMEIVYSLCRFCTFQLHRISFCSS